MPPSASDIGRAVELVRVPEDLRSADEQAFLLKFQQEHLQFGDADPSSVAAQLSTQPLEMFEIYQALRTEELRRNSPPEELGIYTIKEEAPAPVEKEKPKKPAAKRVRAEVAEDDDLA